MSEWSPEMEVIATELLEGVFGAGVNLASHDLLRDALTEIRRLREKTCRLRTAGAQAMQEKWMPVAVLLLCHWQDMTSQEMYGEAMRETLSREDFELWDATHAKLRELCALKPENV